MKKCINAWSIPSNVPFEEMFKQIKTAGFDGIELNIDASGSSAHALSVDTTPEELKKIKDIAEKYELTIPSISTSQYRGFLGSCSKENNETAKNLLRKQLEFAAAFGSTGILVVPGGISKEVSLKKSYEDAFETLSSMKSELNDSKIWVGLENVWNTFFMSPFDMKNFIDDLNIKSIGAYFDVGNVVSFSEPEHWIEILGNRIKKIHVKDYARCGRIYTGNFVNLLEGTFSWKNTMVALKDAGYDDYLTVELGVIDDCPEYLYDISSKALDIMIKM